MRHKTGNALGGWRFQIVRPLGSGGFGAVYEAVDHDTGKRVALKELTRVSPASLVRFKQEFRALSDVHHPNLVSIRELIEQEERWYIVMELIEGFDLIDFVRPVDARSSARERDVDARGPAREQDVDAREQREQAQPGFDEARLRKAFAGVARGLHALHGHGLMHRDLKPSNVRVTKEGRAVLLDFGLATSLDSAGQSTHAHCVGTVLYMAPEQLSGGKLGGAADWYAFGTCLYEALTGRLPYEGALPMLVAHDKQRREPTHPNQLVAGLPEDLSELCMALLRNSAECRPSGEQVLELLGALGRDGRALPLADVVSPPNERTFAGRQGEMEHLERALTRTDEGELRIVLVEGESGVGKSELVAEFVRQQQQRDPRTLVLRGRCYENEQVSYKAFDGCVDDLSRVLKRFGSEAEPLLPNDAALLAQVFPVLGDVPAIVKAKRGNVAADPTARRLQAFAALSGLLSRVAEERPLILAIDDLQWADSESFRLLRAFVEDARSPPMLVLCTVRPRQELDADVLGNMETVRALSCVDVIPITGLPRAQAEELARALLGPDADPKWASIIAYESRGHPLFLSELIHFSRSRDLGASGSLTLEAALKARIERLPARARALLELVSLAGRPHRIKLFGEALGAEELDEEVSVLLAAKLLRARRDRELGCFHDRIRHVMVGMIASARLPYLHTQLARALEQDLDADPTELASHWDLAEAPEHALNAYERAADQALAALAFVQAERLYTRALELLGTSCDERYARLTIGRADALGFSGRSAEAARLYQRASELSVGEEQSLRLRTKTAQHLMLSGDVAGGMLAVRPMMRELGISLPRTDLGSILRAIWDRVVLRLNKYELAPPPPYASPRTRLLLELLHDLMRALSILRTTTYLALSGQHTRRALSLGDVAHAARAYANEAWLRSARRDLSAGAHLFAQARALCERSADPAAAALVAQQEGSALIAGWDWVRGSARLEEAERLYQAHVAHDPWSLTVTRYLLGAAWFRLGEHARLAERMELWIGEARERRDRVAVALLSGMGNGSTRHLRRGLPHEALRELDDAIAAVPAEPFSFAHLGHMVGTQQVLYQVSAKASWEWLESKQKMLRKPHLLKTRFGRDALVLLRSTAALRACERASPSERKALLQEVRNNARWLAKQSSPFTKASAAHYLAQAAALEGDVEGALEQARVARQGFARVHYTGLNGTLYLEGMLEGGQLGAERCAAALATYREQGWVDPQQALTLFLPALPALNERRARPKHESKKFIHHYELVAPLGSGGFGTVFEARDVHSGRSVALKELVSSSGRSLERFKQEFRALADLNHPNLVRFDALFEHQGAWYIAMELVRGASLIHYVRPQGTLDAERLRRASAGLLSGVSALHEAGFVHRDICPSNVCVTEEGRAVLLDFGLIARVHDARDAAALGNADYAPPEQLEGVPPHPSADVYALGSCLYEALTGKPPYAGRLAGSIANVKRTHKPRLLDLPKLAAFAECALQMLAAHPAERPQLSEVIGMLAAEGALRRSRPASLSLVPDVAPLASFQGRAAELEQLAAAFARSRNEFTLVMVEGESGLGKSALCAEFARRSETEGMWVLGSRCYENELLTLKMFDGMVDQLAAALRTMSLAACEELLPRKAALLAQLFPVLGSVFAIAKASKKGLPAEPMARRRQAIACFMELLERLSRERPILLVFDDLQWADVESLRLLASLSLRGAALPLMVVCTMRPRSDFSPEAQSELDALNAMPGAIKLPLSQLSVDDAVALSASLLGDSASAALLRRLGEESKGHPLYLRELVEHARSAPIVMSASVISLDEAVRARIERVEPDARLLISLLSMAGRPYSTQLLAAAMGRAELPGESVNQLLNLGLLRRRGEDGLTCYHDRIRYVALASMSGPARCQLAAQLAEALEGAPGSDPAERARLWCEAEQPERALPALEAAGDAALEKLAFEAADQHYARALELTGPTRDVRWRRLSTQRGHALVRMGKNAQAAHFYAEAAQGAEGEQRVRLRVWAAQNLIQGAQVEQGLNAAAQLLSELGVPFARTPRRAMLRVAWESSRLKLRGVELKPRSADAARPAQRLALDALNELSQPVASVMFMQGAALSAQHVRYALDAGEPAHAARALAYEAMLRSTRRPQDDHTALFARARELAQEAGDPAVIAAVEVRHGIACLASDDYEAGRDSLLRGHEILVHQCPGQPWLLTNTRMQLGVSHYILAEHAPLASYAEAWLSDAKQREDLYAHAALAGYGFGFFRHLMRDDAQSALAELAEAMGPWRHGLFSTNHFGEVLGNAHALAYSGGDAALRWFEENRARLERAIILKNPVFKFTVCNLRIMACLSAAESARPERTRALLREVAAQLSMLGRMGSPLSVGFAALWSSALSALAGNAERALAEAQEAQRMLSRRHKSYGMLALFWQGWLEGGEAGREKCQRVFAILQENGWRTPLGYVHMSVPMTRLVAQAR